MVGEASPDYLFSPFAPGRVAATLPNAKPTGVTRIAEPLPQLLYGRGSALKSHS